MSWYPVPCISAGANGQLTYDTGRGSQYRVTECGTNGKYNNEPNKTGVPKDAPVGSWGGGRHATAVTCTDVASLAGVRTLVTQMDAS